MNLSIIIPLLNESDSISLLADEICTVLSKTDYKYEVIFIDDGSSDSSWSIINSLTSNPVFKGIRFKKNLGKSTALDVGFLHAKGRVVVTMDADLQDDPSEILDLYDMIVDGMSFSVRMEKKRLDPMSKTIPTKLYNWATRIVSVYNYMILIAV